MFYHDTNVDLQCHTSLENTHEYRMTGIHLFSIRWYGNKQFDLMEMYCPR
jgi:hypothetical protein